MPFLVPCCDGEAILWKKKFCPSHLGWRGNMEKFWSWLLRSWLQRPRSQWLGQPSLWNEHIYILYEKRWLWQSEISEIEPAQLTGLIWRGPQWKELNANFKQENWKVNLIENVRETQIRCLRFFHPGEVPMHSAIVNEQASQRTSSGFIVLYWTFNWLDLLIQFCHLIGFQLSMQESQVKNKMQIKIPL